MLLVNQKFATLIICLNVSSRGVVSVKSIKVATFARKKSAFFILGEVAKRSI